MRKALLMAVLATGALGCGNEVRVGVGCVDDLDCLAGEFCDVDGFCVADDTYRGCNDTADCLDPLDLCWEVDIPESGTFGRFCSNECASDVDCQPANAFGGVCYAIAADPTFLCYQQCDFDSDCFLGSVCIEVDLGGGLLDLICVPN